MYPNVNNLKTFLADHHAIYYNGSSFSEFTNMSVVNDDISLIVGCKITIEGTQNGPWHIMCGKTLGDGIVSGDVTSLNELLYSSHQFDVDKSSMFSEILLLTMI